MRILLITPYFYPHKGGSQIYAEELYTTLMKKDHNVSVDVLTYNTDGAEAIEQYKGFTIYRIPCFQPLNGQFAVPNYLELRKTVSTLFNKNRYDFINSHTRFFESSWWVPFVARHYNTKSILTDHCANHPKHASWVVSKIAYLIDELVMHTVIKQYDFITVVSQATKQFLSSHGVNNTHLIYGGVNTKYFKPGKRNAERRIQGTNKTFSKNDIIISFVGRMIPSKGPQLLLRSAEIITRKYKNVHFVFGGNGSLYKEFSSNTNENIFFLGELEKKDIANLLSKTDILVHPSMHHEGFPLVLLEAGASGCAVIATNMGGTNEIINDSTGAMAKPTVKSLTHHIEFLIRNKKKRLKYGENLREWVRTKYDWNEIVKSYKYFIQEKIERPSLFPIMKMTAGLKKTSALNGR